MKIIYISTFALAAVSGFAAETNPSVPYQAIGATNAVQLTPRFLSLLADEMRTNHPALKAAHARTNAATAGLDAIRTWEDPMAKLGGMAAREEMRADEGDIIYGVDQKLPLFGKPELARRVARAEIAAEMAGAEYQFQIQRRDLAKAAFSIALADHALAIEEQDLDWLTTLARATEGKFRAGQATLMETTQVENERARRETQLQTDRDQRTHLHAALNRLLNRELSSPWPRFELPPLAGVVPFDQRLVGLALRNEPKILLMQEQIRQVEAAVNLSRRQRLPDISMGLEARNYSGNGSFRQGMLVFSMNLPWGNGGRYRNDIRREEARLQAAQFELADYQASVREEIHGLTVRINSARREALLYHDQILPRTQSALDSARAAWEAGQGAFRDVLDARRMLLEARLMHVRAVAEQYQMLSELVLCCGLGELDALPMIGAEPQGDAP